MNEKVCIKCGERAVTDGVAMFCPQHPHAVVERVTPGVATLITKLKREESKALALAEE